MTTTNKREHETSGTARREAHQMSGRGLVFRVGEEIDSLRHDLEHTSGGRAAKTLAKTEGLRHVGPHQKDVEVDPEATAGGASIEILAGRLRAQAGASRGTSASAS